jgi:hypothetical protein
MQELIDKTAAYNALTHEAEQQWEPLSAEAYDGAARIIDQMPTIEPEQKHGHIVTDRSIDYCSECGKCLGIGYTNYCGYCGAELEV